MNKKILKIVVLWFIIGMVYYVIEGIWRIPQGGYANIVMLPIGGLCGASIGLLNQHPKFYNLKLIYQSLIGTFIVISVEFISGLIVNIWLKMNIWDYSNLRFNILGQVSLTFSVIWFLLIPTAIWLEDRLRFVLWKEGYKYSLLKMYIDFFSFR